ncbi:MAG: cytochrome C [Gemmatimonadetes bacterium]|nr:cytochrome C [Gemmatimonadota bacterium]
MRDRQLPESVYNWTSVVGVAVAVASFCIIVLLLLIDAFVDATTAYLGLLTFIVLPIFVCLGLVLIAVGMLIERRRLQRGAHGHFRPELNIDLRNSRHRRAVAIFTGVTGVFLMATAVGSYNAYQETESVEFCGAICHVMHPEFTAYQSSPHAHVSCAECHIGAGAGWYVQSKLSGAYQVYSVLAEKYPRPIPTPVHNLRPARETCEHCHWPDQFFGARMMVNQHFLGDEQNTPHPISLLLKVGGPASSRSGSAARPHDSGDEGIHWHVSEANRIDYAATDDRRLDIAWVKLTDELGQTKEWTLDGEPVDQEVLDGSELRTMDCIDCHNRPSHNYRSPTKLVNQAIADGRIDRRLPFIKREAVTCLDDEYETTSEALSSIDEHLRTFYADEYPEVVEDQASMLDASITSVQGIFQQSLFPEMKVTWRDYPDHVGHSESIGCFRCHGSDLTTAAGEQISKDCSMCHSILAQGSGPGADSIAPSGLVFEHPVDIYGEELETNCTECHEGGAEIY